MTNSLYPCDLFERSSIISSTAQERLSMRGAPLRAPVGRAHELIRKEPGARPAGPRAPGRRFASLSLLGLTSCLDAAIGGTSVRPDAGRSSLRLLSSLRGATRHCRGTEARVFGKRYGEVLPPPGMAPGRVASRCFRPPISNRWNTTALFSGNNLYHRLHCNDTRCHRKETLLLIGANLTLIVAQGRHAFSKEKWSAFSEAGTEMDLDHRQSPNRAQVPPGEQRAAGPSWRSWRATHYPWARGMCRWLVFRCRLAACATFTLVTDCSTGFSEREGSAQSGRCGRECRRTSRSRRRQDGGGARSGADTQLCPYEDVNCTPLPSLCVRVFRRFTDSCSSAG